MKIIKKGLTVLIFCVFCFCIRKKHQEKELVIHYFELTNRISEKYYRVKNNKNLYGEDLLDSLRVTYYKNGRINGISFYNSGQLDGWQIIYDDDGKKLKELLWIADMAKESSETVKIINYNYYDNGMLEGIYISDREGKIISETTYDKNGRIIP